MEYAEPKIDCWQYIFDLQSDIMLAVMKDEVVIDGWRYADVLDATNLQRVDEDSRYTYRSLEWLLNRYRLVRYNGRLVQVAGCRGMLCKSVTDAPEGRLCPDGMQMVYRLVEIHPEGLNTNWRKVGNDSGEVIAESIEEMMAIISFMSRDEERKDLKVSVTTDPTFIIEYIALTKLALQTQHVAFREKVYDLVKLFELNPQMRESASDPEENVLRNLRHTDGG